MTRTHKLKAVVIRGSHGWECKRCHSRFPANANVKQVEQQECIK